jgi:isoleucyl-tRNA synthetase
VLGNDGQKMSKSLRNYPDVNEVFDRYGSDAMRWFLMASPILRGGNLIVTEQGIRDAVRQAILPLWNSYYFFALYANAESYQAKPSTRSEHVLDRYILAKTRAMVTELEQQLDVYNVGGACQLLREHLEVLTNWYIRRSRSRFWAGERDALDTLWTVLETVCRAAAPLLPLTTEAIWRGLTGEPSVHLAPWPDVQAWAVPDSRPNSGTVSGPDSWTNSGDPDLTAAMDLVRAACSTALGLRKARQLRVRLPLASLVIAHADAKSLAPFADLIADEVNVKTVELSDDVARLGTFELAVNPRLLGPRLGAQVQQVIKAVKAGDWAQSGERVIAAGIELEPGEYQLRLVAAEADSTSALPGNAGLIALDTRVTPELAAEGTARDVVRIVQQARRDAGLSVSDRIRLTIGAEGAVADAVRAHAGFVAAETLAVSLDVRPAGEVDADLQPAGDGAVKVALVREPDGTR